MYTGQHTTSAPASLGARAHAELKRRLLWGEFRLGAPLRETVLADQLGMSRTPVREALSRLHAEGLVVRMDDGGFSPSAPDLHTVSELYEIRRSLELTAIGRGSHDADTLEGLLADWRGIDRPAGDDECGPDFVLHDEDFHVRLAMAAGNRELVGMLRGVNERIRSVRMHDFLTADRVAATIDEHQGIASSLLAGNAGEAADELRRHLRVSEEIVESRAAIALSRMIGGRDA